jgi:Ca2+/Na+ antiporter
MGVALSFFLPENVMEEHFSPVLLCSACALVVVVMANLLLFGWHFKFKLNKGFGVFLIAFWITVMIINVILEIRISQ